MRASLRPFLLPLLIVAVLAGALGFMVTRSIAGDPGDRAARVSVVGFPGTPTPEPTPTPTPTAEATSSGRGGTTRDPRCPAGCECSFPNGGTVVVCQGGGAVRIP